jgi:hypothetical protein
MKKIIIAVCLILGVSIMSVSTASAESWYAHLQGDYPQFKLTADALIIWGGPTVTNTGFSSIDVTTAEEPYQLIETWYKTMLAAKLANRQVRIIYSAATGDITQVIPL